MSDRATASAAFLSIQDLSVNFGGIVALDSISLEVGETGVVGIIGPNGAGKTTLFNCISGFVSPTSGSITWRGAPLAGVRPHRLSSLSIGRTLQGVGLFPKLSVLENVMLGAHRFRRARLPGMLLGLPGSVRDERRLRERALAALERVRCAELAERVPGSLPYATQKQVALARALAADPALLLLDEPAGGLDTRELSDLASLIEELGRTIAVMLVDHHMDLVVSVCDRMVVLDFGRLVAEGVPSEIRQDPRVMEAYLGQAVAAGHDGGAVPGNAEEAPSSA